MDINKLAALFLALGLKISIVSYDELKGGGYGLNFKPRYPDAPDFLLFENIFQSRYLSLCAVRSESAYEEILVTHERDYGGVVRAIVNEIVSKPDIWLNETQSGG